MFRFSTTWVNYFSCIISLLVKVVQLELFHTFPIPQVSFNPHDNTQVCAVGEKIFKLFRYNDGNLKQFAIHKVNALNYFSHVWLSEDHLLLGTDGGQLQLFEVGDLKNEFQVGMPQLSNKQSQTSSRDISRKAT